MEGCDAVQFGALLQIEMPRWHVRNFAITRYEFIVVDIQRNINEMICNVEGECLSYSLEFLEHLQAILTLINLLNLSCAVAVDLFLGARYAEAI